VYAAITLLHQSGAEPHDLNTAQQLLIQAIQTDPTLAEAYYQLGVVQQQRLQWNESAASLQKAIQLRPAFAEAHYRLSRAYSHTGRPDDAQKEIALQQRFSQQEKQENDAKLKEITTFLIAPN
jgi:tetratricopeptide (TPR) repeat protein